MSNWPKPKILTDAEVFEASSTAVPPDGPATSAPLSPTGPLSNPAVVTTATLSSPDDVADSLHRLRLALHPRPSRPSAPAPVLPAVSSTAVAALLQADGSDSVDVLQRRIARLEAVCVAHPISDVRPALVAFAGADDDADFRTVAAAALATLGPLDPDIRRELLQRSRRAEAAVQAFTAQRDFVAADAVAQSPAADDGAASAAQDLRARLARLAPGLQRMEQMAERLATLRPVHAAAVRNARAMMDAERAHEASQVIVASATSRLSRLAEIRAANDVAVTGCIARLRRRIAQLPPADDPRLTEP